MSTAQHMQPRRVSVGALPITVILFLSLKHAVSIFVSILIAKYVCIMRKIIVNPRRFSRHKDFRKHHKALINKEKPAISMDCWFSMFWWRWGELNPRPKALKQELLRAQQVFSGRCTPLFPSGQANRQACQSGSFMMHGTRKA